MVPGLRHIFSAPHRLGFLAGGSLFITSMLLWALELTGRSMAVSYGIAMPAMFWHGQLMVYGFFPLFMMGFIYTAGPRWLHVAKLTYWQYAPVMLAYALGTLLCLLGYWFVPTFLAGSALQVLAWLAALAIWWSAIMRSSVSDKMHATAIGIAFTIGLLGLLMTLLWLQLGAFWAWQLSVRLGVWGFLLPVFLVVSHRMLPFFSGNVLQPYSRWQPAWLIYTWGSLLLVRIVFESLQRNTLLADLPLAIALLYTSWRWRLIHSFKVKLLAMLHAAFAWAGLALLLFTTHDILLLLGLSGLGFAPLHALTLGFFCTMLLGFVTRVTLGHSGYPLVASRLAWGCYWAMHSVTLARVLGELAPAWQQQFYLLAAMLALIAWSLWGRLYLPMYWQARADGQPD